MKKQLTMAAMAALIMVSGTASAHDPQVRADFMRDISMKNQQRAELERQAFQAEENYFHEEHQIMDMWKQALQMEEQAYQQWMNNQGSEDKGYVMQLMEASRLKQQAFSMMMDKRHLKERAMDNKKQALEMDQDIYSIQNNMMQN